MGNSHTGDTAAPECAPISTFYSSDTWIEGRSITQLEQVAAWPGMKAVAAFPDLHPGRHGPVGAAFLADRIYPQLVGPDIGCGMALFRLDLPRRKLKLEKAVRRLASLDGEMAFDEASEALDAAGLSSSSSYGLGTIGGGNHFCEVQEVVSGSTLRNGSDLSPGDLCLLVHSGSRSLGAGIFTRLEEQWSCGFASDSTAAVDYLELHDVAVKWAALNRRLIAVRAAEALRSDLSLICDAPHNLVEATAQGWLHRKGAAAPHNGLAPLAGSRDDHSYLLEASPGEGALWSVSHGAGRKYDRSSMHGRIQRVRSELTSMSRNRFGGQIICADRDLLIEEAGPAYKSAQQVAKDLEYSELARRAATLAPLITFKTGQSKGGRK